MKRGCKKIAQNCEIIARFLKSGIPIYNSEVQDTAGRKTRRKRRRTQATAKRFAFYTNSISKIKTENMKTLRNPS